MPVMANSILKQIDIDISGTLKIKEKKIKRGKKNGGKLHKKKNGEKALKMHLFGLYTKQIVAEGSHYWWNLMLTLVGRFVLLIT